MMDTHEDTGIVVIGNPQAARLALAARELAQRIVFREAPSQQFDGNLIHVYLRDGAAFMGTLAGPSFDAIQSPSALYDYKTQRRSGRALVHESRQELLPQMFSKGLVAGESKPVKHNPGPSRFGFLDGLKNHKRR